jgi:hypothetical protein
MHSPGRQLHVALVPTCDPRRVLVTLGVQDVAWHMHHKDIFGSVGDDRQLILWDTRRPPREGGAGGQGVAWVGGGCVHMYVGVSEKLVCVGGGAGDCVPWLGMQQLDAATVAAGITRQQRQRAVVVVSMHARPPTAHDVYKNIRCLMPVTG